MRVVIDGDRCTGHGRCYSLAPELFEDDEYGFGKPIGSGDLAEARVPAAERAVRACPEGAIRVE
jgi:ferredoxin